ncbi:MAG: hypothetical protein H6745_15700 [Deltaproteobacteria bacterium]|nr:hypothetical protein [Deltaproteobacteria bacterium]
MENDVQVWADHPGWVRAHQGLKIYFWGLIAYVAFAVLITILAAGSAVGTLAARTEGSGDDIAAAVEAFIVWARVGAVGFLAIQAVLIEGLRRYAQLPKTTNGRTLAVAAFWLSGAALALALYRAVDVLFLTDTAALVAQAKAGGVDVEGLVNTLLNLGMLVCFIRSMQLTAEAVGEVDHAARARLALVLAGVVAILQIGSTVLAATSTDPHGIGAVAGLLGIAFLGIGIWMLVNYLMVIYGLSQSIARHVDLSRSFD